MTRFLLLVVVACGAAEPEPLAPVQPLPRPPPAAKGLSVDWSMRVEGDQLRIDYTITNATDSRVTVMDALPVKRVSDYNAIVVRGDTTPDAIAFTRAFVLPESGIRAEIMSHPPRPHYRDISPGDTLRGTARTRLPLGAWHNFTAAYAIYGPRPNAVLEIGYYDYPDINASNVHRASWRTHPAKLLRGAVKPLPRGVTLASPEEQGMIGCPSPCPEPTAPPGAQQHAP